MAVSSGVRFLFYPLLVLGCIALAPLLRKGGAPVQKEEEVIYPTRPGMKVIYYLFGVGGLVACVCAARETDPTGVWLASVIGFSTLLGAAYGLSVRYRLDAAGVHYSRLWGSIIIPWDELDHYELLPMPQYGVEQIYLRSRLGTSIAIADIQIDSVAFMKRVQKLHKIKEKPYQRRHWWGG